MFGKDLKENRIKRKIKKKSSTDNLVSTTKKRKSPWYWMSELSADQRAQSSRENKPMGKLSQESMTEHEKISLKKGEYQDVKP